SRTGRVEGQELEADLRGGQRGDLAMIIGRCDLDHIESDKIETLQAAQNAKRLSAGKPAHHRRPGARRIGRVQTVDIEGQVDLSIADSLPDPGDHGVDTMPMDPGSVQDRKAVALVVMGAD